MLSAASMRTVQADVAWYSSTYERVRVRVQVMGRLRMKGRGRVRLRLWVRVRVRASAPTYFCLAILSFPSCISRYSITPSVGKQREGLGVRV